MSPINNLNKGPTYKELGTGSGLTLTNEVMPDGTKRLTKPVSADSQP